MASFNKVILLGRLTANPELRHTASGLPVVSFTLAVDRRYTKGEDNPAADFINIVAWRNTAEFVSRYFGKGKAALVEGSLQQRNWTDRDGNKRTTYEVVADNVQFAERKSATEGPNMPDDTHQSFPSYDSPDAGDFKEISDEDELPF